MEKGKQLKVRMQGRTRVSAGKIISYHYVFSCFTKYFIFPANFALLFRYPVVIFALNYGVTRIYKEF